LTENSATGGGGGRLRDVSRSKRWLRNFLFALIPTLVVAAALELGARILGARPADPLDARRNWFDPIRPRVRTARSADGDIEVIDPPFHEAKLAVHKPSGELRVFTFGGSSAFGHRLGDDEPFAARLGPELEALSPGRRFVSANLAVSGRDSFDMLQLAEYSLRFSPDVWILYEGHNDLINYQRRPRTYAFMKRHDWLWRGLFALQDHSRFVTWLTTRGAAQEQHLVGIGPDRAAVQRYEKHIVDQLIGNYEKIFALARAHGVRVIVVLPPSNLYDNEPAQSLDDSAAVSAASGEARTAPPAKAATILRDAIAGAPDHARLHYELGHVLDQLGDADGMYRELVAARDLDAALVRATSTMQEAQRALAAREGAPVLDAPALLAAASPSKRVGCNFFRIRDVCDWLHPNARAHALFAHALAPLVVGAERR
jgi:lysophospholipase L1-like esterase